MSYDPTLVDQVQALVIAMIPPVDPTIANHEAHLVLDDDLDRQQVIDLAVALAELAAQLIARAERTRMAQNGNPIDPPPMLLRGYASDYITALLPADGRAALPGPLDDEPDR